MASTLISGITYLHIFCTIHSYKLLVKIVETVDVHEFYRCLTFISHEMSWNKAYVPLQELCKDC